jgi:hypothetical protein
MTTRKYVINAENAFYKQEYCGCSYSLRDNNFHRRKDGLPPIKPANADVYSDPLADAEEESPDVVRSFFDHADDFADEIRAVYQPRRKRADSARAEDNNW